METKLSGDTNPSFWTEADEMLRNHTLQDLAVGGPWILKSVIPVKTQNTLGGGSIRQKEIASN